MATGTAGTMQVMPGPTMSKRGLDATDERILRLLVRNARASYRDLGVEVGLSANAVAQRMRRMERLGHLRGYTAVVETPDDAATVSAVVHLRTVIDADADDLEARLAAMPAVVEVLDLAGDIDYQLRLRCDGQQELYDTVNAVRQLPGVAAMQTRPVLREVLRR